MLGLVEANEEAAAAKYQLTRAIDRIKEMAHMYRTHGFHEYYYLLLFVASILEAERVVS